METLRRYVSDGVVTRFAVDFELGYLEQGHIYVYAGEDDSAYEEQLTYIWVSDSEIELTEESEYPIGTVVNVRRVVPRDVLYVIFDSGGINDESLNNGNKQSLMILQEIADGIGGDDTDMGGLGIINLRDGVDPQDAVTMIQLTGAEAVVTEAAAIAVEAAASAASIFASAAYRGYSDGVNAFVNIGFTINTELNNTALYIDGVLQYDAFPCDSNGTEVTTGTTTYLNMGSTPVAGLDVLVKAIDTTSLPIVTQVLVDIEAAKVLAVASADEAAVSEVAADEDATQTALDRAQTLVYSVATAADRVQTGLDVNSTAGDRVQTDADSTATAADRVQTGLDREALAAAVATSDDNATATAADAVLTAADRVQTGLDKVATAADRVDTGVDKVATAADRVQTGLDKIATEGFKDDAVIARDASEAAATATQADALSTGDDATATAADRVQTTADAAQTVLDAAQTESDAIQTTGDAVTTTADAVQTALDVIDTTADAVQTGLDAASASASATDAANSASLNVVLSAELKSASFTALPNVLNDIDSRANVVTMTLPLNPLDLTIVRFRDKYGSFETFNFTIGRNGKLIQNIAEDLVVDVAWTARMLIYTADSGSWGFI